MEKDREKGISEENVRHKTDSTAISKIEKDNSKSPLDRREMQSSVKEKGPEYPGNDASDRPNKMSTEEELMKATNNKQRRYEDIKIVVSSYAEYTNSMKRNEQRKDTPGIPPQTQTSRHNARENNRRHELSDACQESLYYLDRSLESEKIKEKDLVGLDSDLSKDQSRYTATPTEEWDEWTTNSEGSSPNSFLHSEIVRDYNTRESHVQPSDSFDYLGAQKYEQNYGENSKYKDSEKTDNKHEYDQINYHYKNKGMNMYDAPLKPYPLDELYSNGRKNSYTKRDLSESDTDLDNSYVFNKGKEGIVQYQKNDIRQPYTQKDKECSAPYPTNDTLHTQKDTANEYLKKEQYSPGQHQQTKPTMGNTREQYRDENYRKTKTSAIDTYLEIHKRDKSPIPNQKEYLDRSPVKKDQQLNDHFPESKDRNDRYKIQELRKKEQELSLKKQEAEAKKESEAIIKSDVCSSLLSIKNREVPTTSSTKYSAHYVSDLKRLTDMNSKSQENSYSSKLASKRDKTEEACQYTSSKKESGPESEENSKPCREVTSYRSRGRDMKKTCEGIVSENAELLKTCYETSRSSTPILQIMEGRDSYLDNIAERLNDPNKENRELQTVTQKKEETTINKYTENHKRTGCPNILSDNKNSGAEVRRQQDEQTLSQDKQPQVQTVPVKEANLLPSFIDQKNSTRTENTENILEEKLFESEFPSFSAYLKRTYGQTYQYRQREPAVDLQTLSGKPGIEERPGSEEDIGQKYNERLKQEQKDIKEKKQTFDEWKEVSPRNQSKGNNDQRICKDSELEEGYKYHTNSRRNPKVESSVESISPRSKERQEPKAEKENIDHTPRNEMHKSDDYDYKKISDGRKNCQSNENLSPNSIDNLSPRTQRHTDSNLELEMPYAGRGNYRNNHGSDGNRNDIKRSESQRNDVHSPKHHFKAEKLLIENSSAETRYREDNGAKSTIENSNFLSRSKESVYEASGLVASSTEPFSKQRTTHSKLTEQEDASPTISLLEKGFDSMLDMQSFSSRTDPRPNSPSPNRHQEEKFSDRSRSRSRTKKKNVQSQGSTNKQGHVTHKSSPNIKISPTQFREKEVGPTASQKIKYREKENYEAINRDLQERNKYGNTDEQKLSDEFYMEDELTKFERMEYFDKELMLHKSSPNLREVEQIYANVKTDNFVNINNKYSETYPIELNDQDMGLNRKHSHSKKDEISENFRKMYVQNRVMDLKQEAMQRSGYPNSQRNDSYNPEDAQIQRKNMKPKNKKNYRDDSWVSEQEALYSENYFLQRKSSVEVEPTQNPGCSSPARSNTSSTDFGRAQRDKPPQVQHTPFTHESPKRISVGTQMQDYEDLPNDPQNPPKSRIRHKTLAYGVSGQDLDQAKIDTDDDLRKKTYFNDLDDPRGQVIQDPTESPLEIEYKKLVLVNEELVKMWEQTQAENTHLRLELSQVKNENETLRHQLGSAAKQVSQINAMTDAEKREKQIVVKKLAEMEEELKLLALSENLTDQTLDQLKSDNARLREENEALMRAMTARQK